MLAADLSATAERRARSYWLLALGFAERPSPNLLGELITSLGPVDTYESLSAECGCFGDAIEEALRDESLLEPLLVEYTRLFGGISKHYGARPPYESVVRDGAWGGEVAVDVVSTYASAEIAPPLPESSPPDHVAAELRFMAIACQREFEAWKSDDPAEALQWLSRQQDFLDRHVLAWVPQYCTEAAAQAGTDFYRALLALTGKACLLDREDIDTIRESVESSLADA